MPEAFRVDLAELEDIQARIRGFVGFLSDSLAEIQQRTSAAQANWNGPSALAAEAAFTRWLAGANDVAEGIEAMRAAANAAHTRYTNAVAANLAMLGRGGGSAS
ncbi:WXG100 family type VII secretion target [Nocardia brasiliensis]|uniref:WXG100 family type VII secretion target n=1 Tax=Nocardia brasiliensis TaxID=37326 RepID=UPI003D90B9D4